MWIRAVFASCSEEAHEAGLHHERGVEEHVRLPGAGPHSAQRRECGSVGLQAAVKVMLRPDPPTLCLQTADGPASQTRRSAAPPAVPPLQSVASAPTYQRRINTCKAELQQLVQQKREQCNAERMAKQMMESAEWESRPPPPGNVASPPPPLRPGHKLTGSVCFRLAPEGAAGRPPARTQGGRQPNPSVRRTLHLRHSVQRRHGQSLGQPEDGGQDHDHQVATRS